MRAIQRHPQFVETHEVGMHSHCTRSVQIRPKASNRGIVLINDVKQISPADKVTYRKYSSLESSIAEHCTIT